MWSDNSDDLPSGVTLPLPLVVSAEEEEALLVRSFAPVADIELLVVLLLLFTTTLLGPGAPAVEVDPLVDAVQLFELGPLPLEDPVMGGDEEDVLLLLLFDGIREF